MDRIFWGPDVKLVEGGGGWMDLNPSNELESSRLGRNANINKPHFECRESPDHGNLRPALCRSELNALLEGALGKLGRA